MKKMRSLLLPPVLLLAAWLPLQAQDMPVLSPDDDGAPATAPQPDAKDDGAAGDQTKTDKGGAGKSSSGLSIMSAEQGEEMARKIEKLQEDQKKILEKLDQMQKDLDFIKASSRTR